MDFLSILQRSRPDMEQFFMIRDQLIFTGKTTAFHTKCLSCGQCHSLQQCDLFHYQPDIEKIIKKNEFSFFQNRSTYKRHNNVKVNSLDIKQQVLSQVKIWLREKVLERKKREPEFELRFKSSAFSLEEQNVTSNENLQMQEFEEVSDHAEKKEKSVFAPVVLKY